MQIWKGRRFCARAVLLGEHGYNAIRSCRHLDHTILSMDAFFEGASLAYSAYQGGVRPTALALPPQPAPALPPQPVRAPMQRAPEPRALAVDDLRNTVLGGR